MTPITYALNHVRKVIPRQILDKTFLSNWQYNNTFPISLDQRIREDVINNRVMVDCNPDAWTWIYRIPKSLTQGRSIVAALSVSFGEGAVVGATNLIPVRGNSLQDAAAGLLNSSNPIPMIATAKTHLIGDNVVLISDTMALPTTFFLRCWIENDSEMTNLNPRSYRAFAKLTELAVKSFIYNEMVIKMDMGEIFGGVQLGRFKEIIDSYSDAEEMYMTHLNEVMGRVFELNDAEGQRRHIQLMVGGLW